MRLNRLAVGVLLLCLAAIVPAVGYGCRSSGDPPPDLQATFDRAAAAGLQVGLVYMDVQALKRDGATAEELQLLQTDLKRLVDQLPIGTEAKALAGEILAIVSTALQIGQTYEMYRRLLDDKVAAFMRATIEYLDSRQPPPP